MKRLLLWIWLPLAPCKAHTLRTRYPLRPSVQVSQSDSLLSGIQYTIYDAFLQDLKHKKYNALGQLSDALEKFYEDKKINLILYWRSYLQFYKSIYHLKMGDEAKAKEAINTGVDWMKSIKDKSSEDYALLALLQGFSFQFMDTMAIIVSSRRMEKNAKKALALDSTNPRAYYVGANNDFYTPEQYGGGKKVEAYLLKALSLPAQPIKNDYLPSWGKEESYEMLIRFYIRKKKWALAKEYDRKALKAYPKSYLIRRLKTELQGK